VKSIYACLATTFALSVFSCSSYAQTVDSSANAAQPPSPVETTRADIHLACHGNASFVEGSSGSVFAFNNPGGSANAFGYETHRGVAEDDMFVDVVGNDARVKLPGIMIPPLHSGSEQGWRPIDKLVVGDTEITGSFALNFLNKPSISINRVTGHIDVRGLGRTGFSGECRPYDASAAARIF
jgi:hypothetical protein